MAKITLRFKSKETFNKFMEFLKLIPEAEVLSVREIPDEMEKTTIPVMIDLGLPSGTKWADRNLGADSQEDRGDYFRFGEVKPFTKNSPEYHYDKKTGSIAGSDSDAATFILGEEWKTPTEEQIMELMEHCNSEWTTQNGVSGIKITGPNGNTIFLPAAGFIQYNKSGEVKFVGKDGHYWSVTLNDDISGRSLYFGNGGLCWNNKTRRSDGLTIRPVSK
jgi:hypothetical protein